MVVDFHVLEKLPAGETTTTNITYHQILLQIIHYHFPPEQSKAYLVDIT